MQTIQQLIKAATGYSAGLGGRTLYVQACDVGSTLTITLTDSMGTRDTVIGVGPGVKLTPAAGFTKVEIATTADANVQFVVTNGDIDLQLTQIGTNVTNTNANPVPVAIISEPGAPFQVANSASAFHVTVDGTVNVSGATLTATNVGINNTTANPVPVLMQPPGSTPADVGAVAVGTSGASLITASASRKGLRIRNAGAGQLAITAAAGTTFANAAVVIQPGDTYIERDAPQAAWYAVSDTGTTANIQTVS
ncbi:hypothetical protein [Burkholderia cepacia]|uniref:hypothetical protein n=1 Tax=Burkholderia cepacia TaxID=292 RepID=UPI001CF1D6D5|nr:hypothetical protein [Burkholderia cepacia]MCA8115674.1 hypothetical protein [Burkholderia cepacia]MCA8402761.1 hypothetical protein [Burkholderia cepacia]